MYVCVCAFLVPVSFINTFLDPAPTVYHQIDI